MIKILREDNTYDEISCWIQIWYKEEKKADHLLSVLSQYNTEKTYFKKKDFHVIIINDVDEINEIMFNKLVDILKAQKNEFDKIYLEVSNRTNFGESEIKVPFYMTILSYELKTELSFSVL